MPPAAFLPLLLALAADIHIEEPTGIERRFHEVVSLPSTKPLRIVDSKGVELVSQFNGAEVLFPVSLIPGELPVLRALPGPSKVQAPSSELNVRRVGTNRVELSNSRFRISIDLAAAAIVEAYNFTAGPQRMLNLAETTPPDSGWSTSGQGPITKVEILETGPLRARVRLGRSDDTWELTFTAGSPTLHWKASKPFRFAVSAKPYLPFDRFVTGQDIAWPDGPDDTEPPDHDIGTHQSSSGVYYTAAENYGAFGIGGLLSWTELGSARFHSSQPGEALLVFSKWHGNQTALDFRREQRIAMHPLLVNPKRAQGPAGEHWELAWGEKGQGPSSEWRTVSVPGSVQTQWLPKGDWFSRKAEWVSEKEWWYRKRFDAPSSKPQSVRLRFEATDYYADAWWNGEYLGRHEGYIDPYEYDVTARLKPSNELLVRVWTPVSYYWRHRPYTIKGSYGAVDQKPDNITPLGITRPVHLVASNAAYIRDVAVATTLNDDGSATVSVDPVLSVSPRSLTTRLTLTPKNFQPVEVLTASGTQLHVPHPQLWWTWDHGKPNLYSLLVELLDARGQVLDRRTVTVGIREIEKIGWTFYLNRKRMFIRGTNYYYGNLYLSEMNRPAYERDMNLMLGMNVNMIRLHCHYANPEFYDLADESGVLIWQDYLEAWYPQDTAFSLRAAALYDNHIRYVRNHPSVAIWATSDEEDLENYRDLTKHLAPRLALLDPQRRPVVRSTGRFGDAHVYHGWYDGSIWDYTKMDEEFVSELGATALPSYDSLMKFLPDRWPIHGHEDDWVFHKLQLFESMRAWGDPGRQTLREYIPHTQEYVARLFQLALERARIRRYDRFGGILHFHAIDFWPSVTMAAVDFYRQLTKVYETVRNSFAPVGVVFDYKTALFESGDRVDCRLVAVNDTWHTVPSARVLWTLKDAQNASVSEGSQVVHLDPDSSKDVTVIKMSNLPPGVFRVNVTLSSGQEVLSVNNFNFKVVARGTMWY